MLLHTSDWHLGRSLYGRKRYAEFDHFLQWLIETVKEREVDIVLVAGDLFDTTTPSNRAQALYYRFLSEVSATCCRHVVITAGNHDSPTFLSAPKELLQALNVHVVGSLPENLEDEVLLLDGDDHQVQAIVCAIPYLRDRDIRSVEPGESIEDKNAKLVEGVKRHYSAVCAAAELKRGELEAAVGGEIPVIAMGHLFTAGGETVDGDGVRELYVGSLAHVGRELFPSTIDYLALGHLHLPQRVGGAEQMRYCGSPIAMGFGEARSEKQLLLIQFTGRTPRVEEVAVPCFQPLERIVGSLDEIRSRLEALKQQESRAWLEVEYSGREIVANLREVVDEMLEGTEMELRRIKNRRVMERLTPTMEEDETLDDLNVEDVFERCLDAFEVADEEREGLLASYSEIIHALQEEDSNAD